MNRKLWIVFAVPCVLALCAVSVLPASAQMAEVKEKPPMYSYVGFWTIPRAQWGEMAKNDVADQKILDKAMANGTIVGYGNDLNLVHQLDGPTHDNWWSATSMAGLLNVLDQFYKSGNATSPVLASATKHWDNITVSRHYNWHSGSWKDLYTHGSSYKLKSSAPDDAIETLSKDMLVPCSRNNLLTAPFTSTKSTPKPSTRMRPVRSGFSTLQPTQKAWTRSARQCGTPSRRVRSTARHSVPCRTPASTVIIWFAPTLPTNRFGITVPLDRVYPNKMPRPCEKLGRGNPSESKCEPLKRCSARTLLSGCQEPRYSRYFVRSP